MVQEQNQIVSNDTYEEQAGTELWDKEKFANGVVATVVALFEKVDDKAFKKYIKQQYQTVANAKDKIRALAEEWLATNTSSAEIDQSEYNEFILNNVCTSSVFHQFYSEFQQHKNQRNKVIGAGITVTLVGGVNALRNHAQRLGIGVKRQAVSDSQTKYAPVMEQLSLGERNPEFTSTVTEIMTILDENGIYIEGMSNPNEAREVVSPYKFMQEGLKNFFIYEYSNLPTEAQEQVDIVGLASKVKELVMRILADADKYSVSKSAFFILYTIGFKNGYSRTGYDNWSQRFETDREISEKQALAGWAVTAIPGRSTQMSHLIFEGLTTDDTLAARAANVLKPELPIGEWAAERFLWQQTQGACDIEAELMARGVFSLPDELREEFRAKYPKIYELFDQLMNKREVVEEAREKLQQGVAALAASTDGAELGRQLFGDLETHKQHWNNFGIPVEPNQPMSLYYSFNYTRLSAWMKRGDYEKRQDGTVKVPPNVTELYGYGENRESALLQLVSDNVHNPAFWKELKTLIDPEQFKLLYQLKESYLSATVVFKKQELLASPAVRALDLDQEFQLQANGAAMTWICNQAKSQFSESGDGIELMARSSALYSRESPDPDVLADLFGRSPIADMPYDYGHQARLVPRIHGVLSQAKYLPEKIPFSAEEQSILLLLDAQYSLYIKQHFEKMMSAGNEDQASEAKDVLQLIKDIDDLRGSIALTFYEDWIGWDKETRLLAAKSREWTKTLSW